MSNRKDEDRTEKCGQKRERCYMFNGKHKLAKRDTNQEEEEEEAENVFLQKKTAEDSASETSDVLRTDKCD